MVLKSGSAFGQLTRCCSFEYMVYRTAYGFCMDDTIAYDVTMSDDRLYTVTGRVVQYKVDGKRVIEIHCICISHSPSSL